MLTTAPDTVLPIPAPVRRQVSTVVSVLVHDLRQPLSVIEACADYLDLVLPEDDRTRQQLELLQQQVSDANRIMHEALVKLHYGDASAG
jgi:signal transduction histidine kinase